MKTITTALLSLLFAFGFVTQSHAQNVLASSTITSTAGAAGAYNYTLTLTALSGSAPIESFWFAWTPGNFFLQSTPTSITGDNGWTGAGDSGSIQFSGGTPITAGNTVTFTFVSTITPSEMTADVGTASSVVYPGAINFSGTSPNETIGVQTVTQTAPTDVLASSTITSTPGTAGAFNYTLTLTALSNSAPIESFWFAWTPGNFFLQSTPSIITGDNGWTGAGDSGSIQFSGGTPITAGNTVTFTFVSPITPDEMTADVGTNSSVVYPGAINFSGASPNETIGVQTIAAAAATNVLASSTITSTPGTAGTFNYTLTLTALTNSAPIESFWFAWVPGSFFLQSTPSSITGDNGWTGVGDTGSIQFTGGTPVTAGNTVTFTFVSTITPDEMTGDVGTDSSVVYPGAINFQRHKSQRNNRRPNNRRRRPDKRFGQQHHYRHANRDKRHV